MVRSIAFVSFYLFSSYLYAIQVEVITPKIKSQQLELTLTGSIEALNDSQLTSLESGVIEKVFVDAGQKVQKGQVLAQLDLALAKLHLEQSEAGLLVAQVKQQESQRLYDEIVDLTKHQVIAKTLLAERKANLANSQALVAQAQAAIALQQEILNRHTIKAPFAGVIAQRFVGLGEWITPQTPILQLISDSHLRIYVDIPQEYFNRFKQNANIQTDITTNTHQVQSLSISQLIPISDPSSRTFRARIDLPQNTSLISGMAVNVTLYLPSPEQQPIMVIPKSAIKRHPDGNYSVFIVEQSKLQRVIVQLINSQFEQVEVKGLSPLHQVVTTADSILETGLSVTITKGSQSGV
ncbi:efflux RND transporter periplasmic adaptor subunit [Paraglaciecola sp. L3A3]|uniref:efflux RND transporter periplasmic adaptor subunit n=1 Tax=Paraglaciecola sp. L3A3 TaxID=2686358 RepID=UPI00131C1903|nr:efflux RND transporter periplasmic adaptor subunit [Paraglaciecola sp. L3A3]